MAQDPLHGITLKHIITELESRFGWDELYQHFKFNCFHNNPSINSSLKFLRKTPWARKKIEHYYCQLTTAKNNHIWGNNKH